MKLLEVGAAKIIVSLEASMIAVYHGESKELLLRRPARKGDWDRIWKVLDPKRILRHESPVTAKKK